MTAEQKFDRIPAGHPDAVEILLIDDDEQWARATATLLEATVESFAVDVSHSLETGRERFLTTDPECVVCDYQLGDGTGLELLETVRETAPDRPFVLVTGRGGETIASDAIGNGVSDYLPKNQDGDTAEVLARRIQRVVKAYRTTQAVNREHQSKNAALEILTATSDRTSFQERFCRLLVEEHEYAGAWIGTMGRRNQLTPQAIAGCNAYVDAVISSESESAPDTLNVDEPTVAAIERCEPIAVSSISTIQGGDGNRGRWRQTAVACGYDSAAAIPIEHDGVMIGVLGVYSTESAIDDRQQSTLEDFAELIGYVHHTEEWKRSLLSPEPIAIEVEITDQSIPLLPLARRLPEDVRIEVPSVVNRGDGQTVYLARVSGVSADGLFCHLQSVSNLEPLDLTENTGVVRCDLLTDEPTPELLLADFGVRFAATVVRDGTATISGRVSDPLTIERIETALDTRYDDILVSPVWSTTDPLASSSDVGASVLEPLTDRQREVLRHAFYDGYFEIPRGSSATELSDRLDIARATFTQHLRTGQRKLFEQLF